MKDFMKKYHKKKVIGNAGIVLASLVLAFGINIFIIDGTSVGDGLKASIIESEIETKADVYIENNEGGLQIKNSKFISGVQSLSLSISYDSDNLEISTMKSNLGEVNSLGELNSGINTIIIQFNGDDIEKNSNILDLAVVKKEQSSEQINLINVNFKDTAGEQYNLSTSGITF